MKKTLILLIAISVFNCNTSEKEKATVILPEMKQEVAQVLTLEQANKLANLPLHCINTEYPNRLSQTLGGDKDLKSPTELHPAFYGCFDWHSSVHGHWSLVRLLKSFPNIENAEAIKEKLLSNISKQNIEAEVAYFGGKHNGSYERTYGWAWLLKLAEELHTWDDETARTLEANLQPLTQLIVEKYIAFLRPISWEPSGSDFLSPCLEEAALMKRLLAKDEFIVWLHDFLPQLKNERFTLDVGVVSDRTDGHLVHLDGVNFSRAWSLNAIAEDLPEYEHLRLIANQHINYSLPSIFGDSYEGGHWLGSFAIYALNSND